MVLQQHQLAWIIASSFSFLAIVISVKSIYEHLSSYHNMEQQRLIIRLLLMVPIYCVDSLLSLFFREWALYFDTARDVYEGYVIYSFMALLLSYLGGEEAIDRILETKPHPLKHPPPLCCLKPIELGHSHFLLRCRQGVLQFVFVKPLLAVVAVVTNVLGVFDEGAITNYKAGYMYVAIINNFSVTMSMYCLFLFYMAVKEELHPYKPVPKFMCVKAIIFFSFWQSVVVALLVKVGFIHDVGAWTSSNIATGLQDFLICVEMFFAAIAHKYAFPAKDYLSEGDASETRKPLLENVKHAVGVSDVIHETIHTWRQDPNLNRKKNQPEEREARATRNDAGHFKEMYDVVDAPTPKAH